MGNLTLNNAITFKNHLIEHQVSDECYLHLAENTQNNNQYEVYVVPFRIFRPEFIEGAQQQEEKQRAVNELFQVIASYLSSETLDEINNCYHSNSPFTVGLYKRAVGEADQARQVLDLLQRVKVEKAEGYDYFKRLVLNKKSS